MCIVSKILNFVADSLLVLSIASTKPVDGSSDGQWCRQKVHNNQKKRRVCEVYEGLFDRTV